MEDKSIGEGGGGSGEWGVVKGVEHDHWVGWEVTKTFLLYHIGAMLVECQLKPLRPNL